MTHRARQHIALALMVLAVCVAAVTPAIDHDAISDGASVTRHAGHLAGVWATEYAEWFSAHH